MPDICWMKWYLRIEPVQFRSIRDYGKRAVTGSDGVTGGGNRIQEGKTPARILYSLGVHPAIFLNSRLRW